MTYTPPGDGWPVAIALDRSTTLRGLGAASCAWPRTLRARRARSSGSARARIRSTATTSTTTHAARSGLRSSWWAPSTRRPMRRVCGLLRMGERSTGRRTRRARAGPGSRETGGCRSAIAGACTARTRGRVVSAHRRSRPVRHPMSEVSRRAVRPGFADTAVAVGSGRPGRGDRGCSGSHRGTAGCSAACPGVCSASGPAPRAHVPDPA